MIDLNIGKEGKAFIAEPIPEPVTVEAGEGNEAEREEVLVPVLKTTEQREEAVIAAS